MGKWKQDNSEIIRQLPGSHDDSTPQEQLRLPLCDKDALKLADMQVDAKLRQRRLSPRAHQSTSRHIVVDGVICAVRLRKG